MQCFGKSPRSSFHRTLSVLGSVMLHVWWALGLSFLPSHGSRVFLCDRIDPIRNGTLPREYALQGIHIQVGTGIWDERFLAWDSAKAAYGGLEVDLLDELARRARFSYSLVMHNWTRILNSHSRPQCSSSMLRFGEKDGCGLRTPGAWLDKLEESIVRFDLVTYGYWFITPKRMARGAFSPYGFLDAQYWAVVMQEGRPGIDFAEIFSFLTPFSAPVWFCFLALTVFTGLIYRFLEGARNVEDFPDGAQGCFKRRTYLQAMDSVFKASGHITAAASFAPKTWAGKILIMSWTWCIVLILAAYTANLASFLVVQAKNQAPFSSLAGAVLRSKKVCVADGSADQDWFRANFPR